MKPSRYIGDETITLDENSLSDLQILCYYAYSPMYLGDEQTLNTILPLSICNTNANLGISNLFTTIMGSGRTRATCSLPDGVCSGRTVELNLPEPLRQDLIVSDGYSAESSWSNGGGISTSKSDNNFSSSIVVGAVNGDILTFDFSAEQSISANTAYPDNPNNSTIRSRAEASASVFRRLYFTLDVPATYTASVDMSVPIRPPGDTSGAGGGFGFNKGSESLIGYDASAQLGSQTYTGVLSPGDYYVGAMCQLSIKLDTTNTTTPEGDSDSLAASCSASLTIVPNN